MPTDGAIALKEDPMKKNRDEEEEEEEERGDSKWQTLMNGFSPPTIANVANALLPLTSYDDDDEGEDDDVIKKRNWSGPTKKGEADVEEEDSFLQQLIHRMRQRQVEIRRDCPYLDTVNRQVIPN